MAPRQYLPKLLLYLTLQHHLTTLLPVQGLKRSRYFTVHQDATMYHSSCREPVGYGGICSRLSCAMLCMRDSKCKAFSYQEYGDTCYCTLCSQFRPSFVHGGFGIVGVLGSLQLDCPKPRTNLPGVDVTYVSTSPGAVALYTCKTDYTWLSGNRTSVCSPDGKWSPVNIQCVETGCYYYDYYLNQNWYGGKVSVTQTGVTCQGWGVDVPHQRHNVVVAELLSLPPEVSDLNNNYCRNYAGSQLPWCYTMDRYLEYDTCSIPPCAAGL